MSKVNQFWRLLATGLSFSIFGGGCLLLGVTMLPLLLLIPNPKTRHTLARTLIRNLFRLFIEFMRVTGVLTYELHNFSLLQSRQGLLIIANHPTLLDIVFLVAFLDNIDCIVKKAVFQNLFLFAPVTAAGYISNDYQNPDQLIMDCVSRLHQGSNLIIFPEGTRTAQGKNYHLQRGAANIAIRASTPLTPILIKCQPPSLRKGEKWYQVPPQKMHFSLRVQPDFSIEEYTDYNRALAVRLLTQDLTTYFSESIFND